MESMTGAAADSITSVCRSGDVSETVVTMVSDATDLDPLELDPLYDVVDPDALNRLVDSTGTGAPAAVEISFTMAGCQVAVRGDGEVAVAPPSETAESTPTLGSSET